MSWQCVSLQFLWLENTFLCDTGNAYVETGCGSVSEIADCHTVVTKKSESESENEVAQLCPTLCNPMDCSPPGSSVHGILQARILEWVAISFSRGSSQPRDQTWVSCIAGRRFIL